MHVTHANSDTYCGRFAPSPTGPLHFGSLVAALGSYLDARANGGRWLLRMEDLDTPRNVPGAADEILRALEHFGFAWDGKVLWQSQRRELYREVLEELKAGGFAYGCACSRKEIADSASGLAVDGGHVYPGRCRSGLPAGQVARAWRLRVDGSISAFEDRLQGHAEQVLERDVGDFVLLRADGIFAYQLAVVVDDAFQGVSHVVRGADLLDSTPRQLWLQHCMRLPVPIYAHLPVATNASGEKLSKQTLAPALNPACAAQQLRVALAFLGQNPPPELDVALPSEVLAWGCAHWQLEQVPHCRSITALS